MVDVADALRVHTFFGRRPEQNHFTAQLLRPHDFGCCQRRPHTDCSNQVVSTGVTQVRQRICAA